jgi:hypothetical protein
MCGKEVIRCCVPILYLWIVSHINTPRDIFNICLLFDLRPLKIIIDKSWKDLDERAQVEKYVALPQCNFKWKTL